MYQPYEINNFISEYLGNHTPGKEFVMLFGPYMVNHPEVYTSTIRELSWKYPQLQYMLSVQRMTNMWTNTISYGEYKRRAFEYSSEFYKMQGRDNHWSTAFAHHVDEQIHCIREHQKNLPATESAMLSCAGICNVATTDILNEKTLVLGQVYRRNAWKSAKRFLAQGHNPLSIAELLLERHPKDILSSNRNIYLGTKNDLNLLGNIEGASFIKRAGVNFVTDVGLYYFMAMCAFYEVPSDFLNHFLKTHFPELEIIANESLITLAEEYSSYMTDTVEAMESEYLNEGQMQEQSEEQVANMLKKVPRLQEQTQPIDAIMSYIRTHREIKCDQFTNQMFLQESENIPLTQYTIQDEALIAIMEDGTYVCPYTDIVDGWKHYLLCMNTKREFFVISGLRYNQA